MKGKEVRQGGTVVVAKRFNFAVIPTDEEMRNE